MPEFLYRFGYETPEQAKANAAHGWDDECSEAVFIEADSPSQALEWGREISERFVRRLYGDSSISWLRSDFAHWIEEHPEAEFTADNLATLPHVRYGQHPILSNTRNT